MTPISTRTRLVVAAIAVAITGVLFQSVASMSRPTSIEQIALAKKTAVTVASVR